MHDLLKIPLKVTCNKGNRLKNIKNYAYFLKNGKEYLLDIIWNALAVFTLKSYSYKQYIYHLYIQNL